jgi:hypothetical protein
MKPLLFDFILGKLERAMDTRVKALYVTGGCEDSQVSVELEGDRILIHVTDPEGGKATAIVEPVAASGIAHDLLDLVQAVACKDVEGKEDFLRQMK